MFIFIDVLSIKFVRTVKIKNCSFLPMKKKMTVAGNFTLDAGAYDVVL